jgi:hypothetical protein
MKDCFLTFFLAVALLASCMNLPVTEIEIEIPDAETHLVLHAHLVDTDSVITAHLYKSTSFFERDTLEVTLNDPADESNYYQVSFLGYPGPSHSSEYSSISFLSNAPALDMQDALEDGIGREFAYLSDETFNGASFHFSVYFREQTAEYE